MATADAGVVADPDTCVLCAAAAGGEPERLVHRGEAAACVMNRYPYTSGHSMVVPTRHVATPADLEAPESNELWATVEDAITATVAAFGTDGVNVGANIGAAAGAGLPDHLHVHVVPRWRGDTNFMTTIGGTRVIPEDLDDSARRLRDAWPESGPPQPSEP